MSQHERSGSSGGLLSRLVGRDRELNRWKGFALGLVASNVALIAMTYYQVQVAPAVVNATSRRNQVVGHEKVGDKGGKRQGALDSISLVGKQYKDEETSTAAMGRIGYRLLTGEEPAAQETRKTLSYLVHWLYGMMMGGLYGAIRGGVKFPDLVGGLVFATCLWLFGDEMVVPLLGLQAGPTAGTLVQHFNRLAAHLLYGAGLSVTTQSLYFAHDWAVGSGRDSLS